MKKVLVGVIIITLIFSLSGCSDNNSKNVPNQKKITQPAVQTNRNIVVPNVERKTVCVSCHGTKSCDFCYGSGSYRNPYTGESSTCTACGGSGRCRICNGQGTY